MVLMPLTPQHVQETLCMAHIYAVAGMAGVDYSIRHNFDYGVDGEFRTVIQRGKRRRMTGFPLDFQAKASVQWTRKNGCVIYDLEAKTYNDMADRERGETTLLLILLCLPPEKETWHATSAVETTMRHGCYWHIITDEPTENEEKKRVFIPSTNLFTPDSLNEPMAMERKRRQGF